MKFPKFLVGLLIGGLLGIILWYWQKSTSAEDGALSVLDRLAASEGRVRDLEARLRMASTEFVAAPESTKSVDPDPERTDDTVVTADNLQEIEGIGPTYARRLQSGGIHTFADLARQTPARVMEISAVRSEETAEAWIREAQVRLSG